PPRASQTKPRRRGRTGLCLARLLRRVNEAVVALLTLNLWFRFPRCPRTKSRGARRPAKRTLFGRAIMRQLRRTGPSAPLCPQQVKSRIIANKGVGTYRER